MKKHNIFRWAITWLMALCALLLGLQLHSELVSAQAPSTDLVFSINPEDKGVQTSTVTVAPVYNVGDVFQVSVVAVEIEAPGIYGGQFEITYDPAYVRVVTDSLVAGPELTLNPVKRIDNVAGLVSFAASQQGAVPNLSGNIVLATLSFEAVQATEPPTGQTTTLTLQNVKLGSKDAQEVPISFAGNLNIIIREQEITGKLDGVVHVQGRAADNQAGHLVTIAELTQSVTTDGNGYFLFTGIAQGHYTVSAKENGFLRATCVNVDHHSDLTTLSNVTLLAGDINGDDTIDITDAAAIGMDFGLPAGGRANPATDLNLDGAVNILDLILMAGNYGATSAANPWVCQ
jgi:hypothetical protein